MNKALLCVAMTTLTSGHLRAGDADPPRIVVYGTATTMVKPDQMLWQLTVSNQGSDLPIVAKAHATIVEGVLALLRDNGILEEDLQTTRMEFGDNLVYQDGRQSKQGYRATTVVSFKLNDFQKYSELWIELSKRNYVSVNRVSYDHTERIEYQDQTRKDALVAAKKKAEAMAATLGARIGEPLLIEDDMSIQNNMWSLTYSNFVSPSSGDQVPQQSGVSPGQIPIKMRVKVEFRLITQAE